MWKDIDISDNLNLLAMPGDDCSAASTASFALTSRGRLVEEVSERILELEREEMGVVSSVLCLLERLARGVEETGFFISVIGLETLRGVT